MLLACPECQRRYRIPATDDGRTLRFACRSCGATVDSGRDGALDALAVGAGPGWLVVHGGQARGPFDNHTLVELARRRAFGPDALVWRDGFDEWRVAGATPPLGPERSIAWWIKIEDVEPVVAGLAQVLAQRPDHAPTADALGKLVRAGRSVAASLHLEAAWEAQGEWDRLVALLDERLAVTDDPAARGVLRRRIGALHEARGEPGAALAAYDEVRRDEPGDVGLIEAVLRAAGAAGDWAGAVRRVEGALGLIGAGDAARLRVVIAGIVADRLGDAGRALEILQAVEGGAAAALRVELLRRSGRWAELAAWYAAAAERESGALRRAALRGLAGVRGGPLGDAAGAAEAWGALLAMAPDDGEALARLAGLCELHPELDEAAGRLDAVCAARGAWSELLGLRVARLSRVPAGAARAAVMSGLSAVYREVFEDRDGALRWAERAAAEDPADRRLRSAHAARASEAGAGDRWVDAVLPMLAIDVAGFAEIAAGLGLADGAAGRFFRAVWRLDPRHEGAWQALRRLVTDAGERVALINGRLGVVGAGERRALLVERAGLEADDAVWGTWGEVLAGDAGDLEALRARHVIGSRLSVERRIEAADALAAVDVSGRLEWMREAARLAGEVGRWWAVLEVVPGDAEALAALVERCAAVDDHAGLAKALEQQRALGEDTTRRLARLYAGPLAAPGLAQARWRQVLDAMPSDAEALAGLAAVAGDAIDRLDLAMRAWLASPDAMRLRALIAPADEAVGAVASVVFAAAVVEATGDDGSLGGFVDERFDAAPGFALGAWARAAERHPAMAAALHRRRAGWLEDIGDLDGARAAWAAATGADSGDAIAWQARLDLAANDADAIEALRHLEGLSSDAIARGYARRRGALLASAGALDEAVEAWGAGRRAGESGDGEVLDALIDLHDRRGDRAALVAVLAEREAIAEPALAAGLAARRARLLDGMKGTDGMDAIAAIAAWQAALAYGYEPQEALAALDVLLHGIGDTAARAEVLAQRVMLAEGSARRDLRAARARVLGDGEALAEWEALLAEVPDDREALVAARGLRLARGDRGEAADWGQRLLGVVGEGERGALLREQGRLLSALGRGAAAIEAWGGVLERAPEDREAFDALEVLLAEDAAALVALLDRRLAFEATAARHRQVASLRRDALGDAEGALRGFDAALALDAGDEAAFAGAVAIADARGDDGAVLGLIERHVAHAPGDRAAGLHREAAVRAERIGRAEVALWHLCAGLRASGDDAGFGPAVERLAAATESFIPAAMTWRATAAELDAASAWPLHVRLLGWFRGPLCDARAALRHAEVVLLRAPDHADALRVQCAEEASATVVAEALRRLFRVSDSAAERGEVAGRAGALWAGPLRDYDAAIEWYRAALVEAPGDAGALDALAGLYEAVEDRAALREIRLRQAALAEGGAALALRVAAARLGQQLGQAAAAIEDWRAVLAIDPAHREALVALRALHARAGVFSRVAEVDARLLAVVGVDDPERPTLLRAAAQVLDGRLGRAAASVEAWEAVRACVPGDGEALDALDRLYSEREDAAGLAAVLAEKVAAAPSGLLWRRLGAARASLDRAGARAAFDAALAIAGGDGEAFEAALALTDDAGERLARIEAFLPFRDDVGLRLRAIAAARAAGDAAAAVVHLAAAVAAVPDDDRFGVIGAELAGESGDLRGLLAAWEVAIAGAGERRRAALRRRALGWALAAGELDRARVQVEALLADAPDDVGLLEALVESCAGDPPACADALARLYPLLDDADARADRADALAAICLGPLGDAVAAAEWLEVALADRPGDVGLLDRLAACHAGDRAALCRIRRRQAAVAPVELRVRLRAEAARLAEAVGEVEDAAADWAAVLEDAPADREALVAARRWAVARGDGRGALNLGDRLLALVEEGADRAALVRSQARLLTGSVRRPERAIDAWRVVLESAPDDAEALDAIEGLAGEVDDPHGLLWVLERRAALAAAPDAGLWVRIGDVRRGDLGDDRGALAAFDAALAADPVHRVAFERACAVCAATGDGAGELDRIEARLGRVEDAAARTELSVRAAELAERAGRPEAALRHWSGAMRASGDDARCGPVVERLAGETGDWATPAAAWRAAAGGLAGRRRLLAWARGPLDDAAEARVHAEAVLVSAPDDAVALATLAETAAGAGERAEALARLFDVTVDEAARGGIARALGALFAGEDAGRAARWFEAALAVDGADVVALAGLAAAHEAREAWGPLLAVRLRQAELGDGGARVEAAVLAERLGRDEEAVALWRGAVGVDAGRAWGALDRLLSARGDWAGLAEVLAARVELVGAGSAGAGERRALWARRAVVCGERLGDREGALACWRAILVDEPDDVEALSAALELAEGVTRLTIRRRLVRALPVGDARRVELRRVLAREAVGAGAVRAWGALLEEVPGDDEALDALEVLHEAAADWAALARVIEQRAGDPRRLLRLARLRDERLGDARGAVAAYDAVWAQAPSAAHEAVFARLVELLGELGDHAGALARIEGRIERADTATRLTLHRQAATIAEQRLGLLDVALRHVCGAFVLSGDEAGAGPEAARLAVRVGDFSVPVATWSAAIEKASGAGALALHLRLGSWAAGPMGEPDRARRHYRAALQIEPEDREALRALAALAEDAPADRAEALEGLLAAESDAEARRALAVRLGDLYAGPLGDADRAVGRYQVALAAAPGDAEALAGLARVHAGRGAWGPLLAVRGRQIAGLHGAARAAMRVEMARLAERLDRRDDAIATWQQAMVEGAGADEALAALDALLTGGQRWRALAKVLARRIELAAGDGAALRALHARRAGLLAERLGDVAGARRHWEAVCGLDGRDAEALWALRGLAGEGAERVAVDRRLLAVLPAGDGARLGLLREVARAVSAAGAGAAAVAGAGADAGAAGVAGARAEAGAAWRAVLAVAPGDGEALDALERLHAADPAGLVEVLTWRHAAAPSAGLRLRIGVLREALGDGAGALADFRAVLAAVPDHAEAFARARRLLLATGDSAGLLGLLEARLAQVGEPAARRVLAEEAAQIAEQSGDWARALGWLGEAFATCRDDAAYGDRVARLAAAAGAWPVAIGRWAAAAEAVAGRAEAVALHLRLASWVEDPEQAAGHRAAAAAIAPDDARVLSARVRAAELARDHAGLLAGLTGLRRQAEVAATRLDLTRRIARLLAGPLDEPAAALAEYTRLLVARPEDGEALAWRADLLRRLNEPVELYAALGALLDRADDGARRRALLEERAGLAERQGWVDEAIDAWRAVQALDPAAGWGALETLLAGAGRRVELEALLVERAQMSSVTSGAGEVAGLWVRAAKVAEQRGDGEGARRHYEAALAADADHPAALRALAAFHAAGGDPAVQARLEARLAARLPADAPEAVEHWRALGRLCQGAAGDVGQAVAAWREVRARLPDDEEALAALVELLGAAGDEAGLADALVDQAAATAGREARAALYGQAAVLREGLGDGGGAQAAWAAVFAIEPGSEEAVEGLVRWAEARGDWGGVAEVLLAHAEVLPAGRRRAGLRVRAAELLADRAGRPGDALRARLVVFGEAPDDGVHGGVIEALAAAAGDFATPAAVWGRVLDGGLPVEVAVPLRMRLARWQAEWLGVPEDAVAQYIAVLDRVPDHAEALARMEALRGAIGDWASLAGVLQQRVARAGDEGERLAALRRLGRVQGRMPDARAAAIATWRRVRRLAVGDGEAADALIRLYRADEKWAALVRLLEELPPSGARLREVAALCGGRLGDRDRAIDALERARALDPDDRQAADDLVVVLREAERWGALRALYADLIRRRPPVERPALLRAQAVLLAGPLGDADAAAEAWRALLRLDAADGGAIEALDGIERAAGRFAGLAEAWARHVAAVPGERGARLRLADLYAGSLGDPVRAIEALRPLAEADGRDREVLRRLASLYAVTGDWRYCADALDREAAASSGGERVDRLREAARVRDERLRDPVGAFERVAEAWRLVPDDEGLAVEVGRLGDRVGRPAALVALYGEVEGRIGVIGARGRVLRAQARLARGVGDAAVEERAWGALRAAVDPDDGEAIEGLVRLLAGREAWGELGGVLADGFAVRPSAGAALALGVLAGQGERWGEAAGWYRRCLDLAPGDRRALAGLCEVERARSAWPGLFDALGRLGEGSEGEVLAGIRAEQARLAGGVLGRPDDARRLWEEVAALRGGEDGEALAALDGLLAGGEDRAALIAVLERRLARGEAAAPLQVRLARLRAAGGERAAALGHWRAAVAADGGCEEALWALLRGGDAREVVDARRRLLARLPAGDARRVELLRARAREVGAGVVGASHASHASHASDAGDASHASDAGDASHASHASHASPSVAVKQAIAAWRAVRAEAPKDGEAAEALAGLYAAAGETAALADLLVESDRVRAARLYLGLGRVATAGRLFAQILAESPGHAEASAALAQMHEAALRWPAVVEVLAGWLAASGDAEERFALRVRIAEVQERRLRAPEAAFEVLIEAFAERPAVALLGDLHRLAEVTDGWAALAGALEQGLGAGEQVEFRQALAAIYGDRLEMPQAAIAHARRAWLLAPGEEGNRVRLEGLLVAVEDYEVLAEVWVAQAERLPAAGRRAVLGDLARLHAERRGDPASAVAVWQDVLAADPGDAEALDALAVLHRETDRLSELCAVLERRFEQAVELDQRAEIALRIADLAVGALGDAKRAIGPLAAVTAAGAGTRERLAEAHERAGDLRGALAVRLAGVAAEGSAQGRAQALIALADRRRAGGHRRPWRALWRALAGDGIWGEVEVLLDAVGRWQDRAELATLDAEQSGGRDRWARVARLHELRRDEREAVAAWQVALAAAPGDGEALDALARWVEPAQLADVLARQVRRLRGGARLGVLRRLGRLGDRGAWATVLDEAPGDGEALDVMVAAEPDRAVDRLRAALGAGLAREAVADRALALVDRVLGAAGVSGVAVARAALELAFVLRPEPGLRDRLAMARAACGDRAGFRALAEAGRAEVGAAAWAWRTVGLRDLDGAAWAELVEGAGRERLAALDAVLVAGERWVDLVALRAEQAGASREGRAAWARAVALAEAGATAAGGASASAAGGAAASAAANVAGGAASAAASAAGGAASAAASTAASAAAVGPAAVEAWRRVLEVAPGDAEALSALEGAPDRVAVWVEQVAFVADPVALALRVVEAGDEAAAIAALDAARLRVPGDRGVLDRLVALRAARGEVAEAAALAAQALAGVGAGERFGRLQALATLRAEAGDLDGAFAASAAAVRAAPDDASEDERLERLAGATGRLADRAAALVAARDATRDGERRLMLDAVLVEMYQGPLAGGASAGVAEGFWRARLEADPTDAAAFAGLARRYQDAGRGVERAALFAVRAAAVPGEAVGLHAARARLLAELGEDSREAWRAVRAVAPGNEEALRALWPICEDLVERDGLARALLARVPAGDVLRGSLHRHLAARSEGRVAAEHWRAVLADEPDDDGAADALEGLRRAAGDWDEVRALLDRKRARARGAAAEAVVWREIAGVEQRRGDAAATRAAWRAVLDRRPGDVEAEAALADAHLAADDVEAWAAVRLGRLAFVAEPAARLALYREVAETLEARLPDAGPAFEVAARAFGERPHDVGLLGEVSRLAGRCGRWDALAERLRAALEQVTGEAGVALALRLAEVEARRGRDDAAAAAWRRVLAVDARSVPALEGLGRYAEARGDSGLLAEVLAARLRTPLAPAEALAGWRRLARLQRGEAAIRSWRAVVERAPEDREALAALVALYRAGEAAGDAGAGATAALAEVLARQVALDGEPGARRALAEVRLRLGDRVGAWSALGPIVAVGDAETLRLMVRLAREGEDWPAAAAHLGRLARVLGGRVSGGAEAAEARDRLLEKAAIEREQLGAPAEAMASLDAAAALDPGHRETLLSIWSLAEAMGDAAAAARALIRLEATGTSAVDRAAWLTRLGELCAGPLGDAAGAVEAWRQAVVAVAGHAPALAHLARHALAEERWSEASGLFERLIAAEPGAAGPVRRDRHLAAARCAEALDDDGAARRHYEAALAVDNTDRATLHALDELAFRQGDWARAFKVGQTLLIHHGEAMAGAERADRLHRLGALKALLGEADRAAAFYRQALEADAEHGPSLRALAAAPTAMARTVASDPSWIGEAELSDAEDAALEAYLFGDGAAPAGVEGAPLFDAELVGFDEEDGPRREAVVDRRRTGAYQSPVVVVRDDGAMAAVTAASAAATTAAVEATAAARAAEAAARAATAGVELMTAGASAMNAGAEAMSRRPLMTAEVHAPVRIEGARLVSPAKPFKGGRVRVVQTPSQRRRWLYVASVASVLIAGLAVGLYTVQSWRLEASESEKARLTRVSNTLAQKVSETQFAFEKMTSELSGQPVAEGAETAVAAVFDGEGKPLDETMLELAFRDLEMREQLGAVRTMLAKADGERSDEAKRNEILETQVAALQGHIEQLKTEQSEVHQRLAGRIDSNIQALETALTATGVDFNSLIDPARGGTPLVVAGAEEPEQMEGVGGPFIADGTKEYVNPVPGETEVMSGFGPRGHSHHNGIDIPAPIGTAVLAVTSGEIIHVQDRDTWERRPKFVTINGKSDRSKGWRAGIYVELRQDDLRISRYMHLSAVAPGITVGARVGKGQVLGSVGRTGVEHSETHLHFELREPGGDGGRFGTPLDPTAAVHGDDVDMVVGMSLLHLDPTALDPAVLDPSVLDAETRKRLAVAQRPAGADGTEGGERLDGRMDRLQNLEKLLREMPLVPPVDELKVSSPFGRRLDPIEGEWAFHSGVDIPGEEGMAVRATAPGVVLYSGDGGRYGVMIEVDHGNGITTRYGHLLRSLVRKGDRVKYRERIGELGSSGRSTGPHLHYEVRVDDKPRDPMNFIQAGRYVFKR